MSILLPGFVQSILRTFGKTGDAVGEPRVPPNANMAGGYVFIHIPKTAGTSMCEALGLPETTHAAKTVALKSPLRRTQNRKHINRNTTRKPPHGRASPLEWVSRATA
jgi:hypothetical protein